MTIRSKGKVAHLEQPLIPLPYPVASQAARDAYNALYDAQNKVAWLMLGMSPKLQRALENYKAHDMIQELKTMLKEQAKQEMFETVKAFHACKQEEGPSDYDQFIQNYNMHIMGKTIAKWHAMPKHHENGIPKKAKTLAVLAIQKGKIQKDKKKPRGAKCKDKGKNKLAYDLKPKIPPWPKRDNLAKDLICYQCKEGLRENKKLKHAPLSLYMGNGMRAAIEAIRSFDLILPSGLIIVLDNCHFAPFVTRGVVSIYHLVNNGYIHTFTNYGISVSKDNVFYFNAIPPDGIYEIDMHNLYTNKHMDKLQRDGILQPTYDESLEKCKSCISGKMARYPKETLGYYFYYPLENKIFVAQNGELFENSLMVQEASKSHGLLESSGSDGELELIYKEDIKPSENTSEIHNEVVPIEDLNEPPNYKAALSDPEFNKWLEAMNTKMQSMKDNQVWVLVDWVLALYSGGYLTIKV
nr:hypothetical protein [Tanacetum cinerariifolium]